MWYVRRNLFNIFEVESPNSLVKKIFRAQLSVKKAMLTVFWYKKGFISIDFLEKGETVKSASYWPRLRFGIGWVGFYGISTIEGYLMPNPVYTYILDIYMICKHIL